MDESWKDSLVPGSHLQVKRRVQSPVGMDGAGGSPRGLGLESGWTVVTVLEVSPTGTGKECLMLIYDGIKGVEVPTIQSPLPLQQPYLLYRGESGVGWWRDQVVLSG